MGMTELKNRYYKDQSPDHRLISGLPLPKDADGIVRNKHFVDCTFHPNCTLEMFVGCTFTDCDGPMERSK